MDYTDTVSTFHPPKQITDSYTHKASKNTYVTQAHSLHTLKSRIYTYADNHMLTSDKK